MQDILGKHIVEQQALVKSFLHLKVAALRPVDEACIDELSKNLTRQVIRKGTEFDVRLYCCLHALLLRALMTLLCPLEAHFKGLPLSVTQRAETVSGTEGCGTEG